MTACSKGYSKSVKALLWDPENHSLQCYPLLENRFGKTAVDYAAETGYNHLGELCLTALEGFNVEAKGERIEMLKYKLELSKKKVMHKVQQVKAEIVAELLDEPKRVEAIIFLQRVSCYYVNYTRNILYYVSTFLYSHCSMILYMHIFIILF